MAPGKGGDPMAPCKGGNTDQRHMECAFYRGFGLKARDVMARIFSTDWEVRCTGGVRVVYGWWCDRRVLRPRG